MTENGINRIITQSTIGASESINITPGITRFLMKHSNVKITQDDHTNAETALKASEANWTSVRATGLSNNEKEMPVSIDYATKPEMMIARKNVARFMVDIIDNPDFFNKLPIISEK